MKLITFTVPCYNSSAYMDHCIESLLVCGDDIEILIVDDGSTKDDTLAKARDWEQRHPGVIRAIHQENAGHGGAVNTGLANADGLYFKVVDSDDWLDADAAHAMMDKLEEFRDSALRACGQTETAGKSTACASAQKPAGDTSCADAPLDMMICNYVYEHVLDNTRLPRRYEKQFPQDTVFTWDTMIGKFPPSEYLLMHSVIYRTKVLRDCGLKLPEHTFYVDNIFVYVPLPHMKTLYYLDVDLYRYFVGREDQSVNEKVMVGRIEQQLRVTRAMIDGVKLPEDVESQNLEEYMVSYLRMMMIICSVFSALSDRTDKVDLEHGIWQYLHDRDEVLWHHIRYSVLGKACNIPGTFGQGVLRKGYHVAQRFFKFN